PLGFSCPSATKPRGGRPPGRIGETARAIREAVSGLAERFRRMTVRQCYYQLEMAGVVEKTDGGYRQVQRQLLAMRRDGSLAWSFIVDGTRWQRKPHSWDAAGDYIEVVSRSYRRNLWQKQAVRV